VICFVGVFLYVFIDCFLGLYVFPYLFDCCSFVLFDVFQLVVFMLLSVSMAIFLYAFMYVFVRSSFLSILISLCRSFVFPVFLYCFV